MLLSGSLYIAIILHAVVVQDRPLHTVASMFDCDAGFIQAVLRACSIHCSATGAFCREIPVRVSRRCIVVWGVMTPAAPPPFALALSDRPHYS